MKLLVTGDLHIGRRAARLPADLASALTPARLWERIALAAVDQSVDAVLLAGDIVDQSNRFFEARAPLERGLNVLHEANIPVVAVSGNHDWDVLRRLGESLSDAGGFRLLGPDGNWERVALSDSAGRVIHLFGRSFPARHCGHCPIDTFPRELLDAGIPSVGLLHAEIHGGEAKYCPVSVPELEGTGVPVWFLGHIHKPTSSLTRTVEREVLYLGSPMGLDPGLGECGVHGAWLATLSGAAWDLTMLPLSPLRYERLALDVSTVPGVEDLAQFLDADFRSRLEQWRGEQAELAAVVLRVTLTGVTTLSVQDLHAAMGTIDGQLTEIDGISLSLDRWDIDVSPPLDLEACAEGGGPLAVAAALLLELEGARPEQSETTRRVSELQHELQSMQGRSFATLGRESTAQGPPDEEACRRMMRRQCKALVAALYGQRGEVSHG
ncbi:MAG: DNA repair exonuclease [Lentisphaeria bacterium]|nr:DNA repair exonuclease [Lentisphaeria bacterium]